MSDSDFEDGYENYDDDLECYCMEEEFDLLEGRAHCWQCGARRWLSSEEMTMRLKLEAECQEAYDLYCEEADKEQIIEPVTSEPMDVSEIPF